MRVVFGRLRLPGCEPKRLPEKAETGAIMNRTTLAVAATLILTNTLFAGLVDCGGEGMRKCEWTDFEWAQGARGCEPDLTGQSGVCVNSTRRTLAKDLGWLGWAQYQQRYVIGADLPLNWTTHVGAHNAFSNARQGFGTYAGQNQY